MLATQYLTLEIFYQVNRASIEIAAKTWRPIEKSTACTWLLNSSLHLAVAPVLRFQKAVCAEPPNRMYDVWKLLSGLINWISPT